MIKNIQPGQQVQTPSTALRPSSSTPSSAPVNSGDRAQVSFSGLELRLGDTRLALPADGSAVELGRLADNDLVLGNPAVSRRHAQMRVVSGRAQIQDLGSTYGTHINGHSLEPRKWYWLEPGSKLELGPQPVEFGRTPAATLESGETKLSLVEGSAVKLGRAEGNDFRLAGDNLVSRHHADIRVHNGEILLQDAGSTNGTSVNGFALKANTWYKVEPGSTLQLGATELALKPGELSPGPALSIASATAVVGGAVGAALTLASLKELAGREQLEAPQAYLQSLDKAQQQQQLESGIVDLPRGVPTIIIPDIHAQRDYLTRALEHQVEGVKVFDLLQQGKMNMLVLGDGMHGEGRVKERWLTANDDFLNGRPSQAMEEEMVESLGTMKMVMELKSAFPKNFVYLRGNHDEMDPEHGYRKYTTVGESTLVKSWVQNRFGDDFLGRWSDFEKSMPLVARGGGFVASHAAPGAALSRSEIEERSDRAFRVLAWTDNTNWPEDSSKREVVEANFREVGADPGARWFCGHRKVDGGNYRGQFDNRLVQINPRNANEFVVALVGADGTYDPDRDTFRV